MKRRHARKRSVAERRDRAMDRAEALVALHRRFPALTAVCHAGDRAEARLRLTHGEDWSLVWEPLRASQFGV